MRILNKNRILVDVSSVPFIKDSVTFPILFPLNKRGRMFLKQEACMNSCDLNANVMYLDKVKRNKNRC